MVVSPAVG